MVFWTKQEVNLKTFGLLLSQYTLNVYFLVYGMDKLRFNTNYSKMPTRYFGRHNMVGWFLFVVFLASDMMTFGLRNIYAMHGSFWYERNGKCTHKKWKFVTKSCICRFPFFIFPIMFACDAQKDSFLYIFCYFSSPHTCQKVIML